MSDQPAVEVDGISLRVSARAEVRLRRLRDELEQLRHSYRDREDLPGLRALVETLLLFCSEVQRECQKAIRTLQVDLESRMPDEHAFQLHRKRVGVLMMAVETALPDPLQIASAPHGREIEALIGRFTDMARNLSDDGPEAREVIFEPSDDYYFQLSLVRDLSLMLDTFTPGLLKGVEGAPDVTVISYPHQLEAETLLHVVIAHEIAHVALDRAAPGDDTSKIRGAFEQATADHADALREEVAADLLEGEDIDESVDGVTKRLKKWFDEMACDALAVVLIGPAYAFALAELDAVTDRWTQLPGMAGRESHPGLAWRLKRVLTLSREFLDAGQHGEAHEMLETQLDKLQAELPAVATGLAAAELALLEAALQPLSFQMLSAAVSHARLRKGVLDRDLPIAWHKLKSGIPPVENVSGRLGPDEAPGDPYSDPPPDELRELKAPDPWSLPLDWRVTLNACWLYWLSDTARTQVADDVHLVQPGHPTNTEDWLQFNEFVRGTLELIDLQLRLQESSGQLAAMMHHDWRVA